MDLLYKGWGDTKHYHPSVTNFNEKQLNKVACNSTVKLKELKRLCYLPTKIQEEMYFEAVIGTITYCIAIQGTAPSTVLDAIDALYVMTVALIHKIKCAGSIKEILNSWMAATCLHLEKKAIDLDARGRSRVTAPQMAMFPTGNNSVKKLHMKSQLCPPKSSS